jgi:putative membrane protein insertion efficiency factor
MHKRKPWLKKISVALINCYQCAVSPLIGGRAACRFTPTCSEYTKQAILKYGVVRGGWMGIKRIIRCRPGGGCGYDPVP